MKEDILFSRSYIGIGGEFLDCAWSTPLPRRGHTLEGIVREEKIKSKENSALGTTKLIILKTKNITKDG